MPSTDAPAVAIDIGGTRTRVALVADGQVVAGTNDEFPTALYQHGDEFIEALAQSVRLLLKEHAAAGVGVCAPGFLKADFSGVAYCPNTPALAGYPLRARLSDAVGIPVALEVDCNAAALAEYEYGAGKTARRLMVISLGTGVGIGVLDSGKPLRFTGGCCGDLGHVFVGGEGRCTAGCKGCLEANLSVKALAAAAGRGASDADVVRRLIDRALLGEPEAEAIFDKAGQAVGIAAASISSFLAPDLVLLAGGISEAGACLTGPAERAFREHAPVSFVCPIRKSRFGGNAALIGAAAAILRQSKES